MYARACVMGSYSESEKASQHRKMPSNAVAALLLSGRDRHNPHDARSSGSGLGAAPRSAVHDRLLQSMRVRFSGSEQWSSPVKPPRSQNYVKPHDARTRVHVAKVRFGLARRDSTYRSGRSPDWLKSKNPACEAVRREAEEDWGK